MNTHLNSVQESLKDEYRAFAYKEIAPFANELDSGKVPLAKILNKLAQTGYLGMTIPQEYGGQSLEFLSLIMLVEAIAEYEPGIALSLSSHFSVVEIIKKYSSETQKKSYLPALSSGKSIAAFALSEETAGTDYTAVKSVLKKHNGNYCLDGKKCWVVNAQIADLMLVLAQLDFESNNLGLVLIDAKQKIPTIEIFDQQEKLGLRSASTNDILFKEHVVDGDKLLPDFMEASNQTMYAMDVSSVIMSAAAIGLLGGCLKQAAEHANSRQQFGANIAKFQAIQWKIADLGVELSGSRLQTYRAAWSKDHDPDSFHKNAAMCKWLSSKAARLYSGEALQILGAKGVCTDSPLARFYRDAKVMEIAQGTSEFQKTLLVKELDI